MGLLDFIFPPTIEKMTANRDVFALIKYLKHENYLTRESAAEALGKIKDARSVEPLIAALKDRTHTVRRNAAVALGEIKDARAVEPLIEALKDNHPWVITVAAIALGNIKDSRAVEPLILVLYHRDEEVREYVMKALGEIKDAHALGPLIKFWKSRPRGYDDSRADEYNSKSAIDKIRSAIENIKDPLAVEPLIKALNDKDSDVRICAAQILGKIKDARAVEPLIKALNESLTSFPKSTTYEDSFVVKFVTEALGEIKDIRAVEPLIVTLKNENGFFSLYAGDALTNMGDCAVELLIIALKDENSEIRGRSALILGKIKDSRAVEPLIKTLNDEDSKVRASVHRQEKTYMSNDVADIQAILKNIGVTATPEQIQNKLNAFATFNVTGNEAKRNVVRSLAKGAGVDPLAAFKAGYIPMGKI